jgi:hypothetical protein
MRREVVPWNLRIFDVYVYIYEARSINKSGRPSPSGMLDLSKLLGLSDINKKQQKENELLMGAVQSNGGGTLSKARESIAAAAGKLTSVEGIKDTLNPKPVDSYDAPDVEITRILYKFKQCEWLPDESSEIFTKVGNVITDRAMQKIAFSYRDVEEINLYTIYSRDVYVQDIIIGQMDIAANDIPFKEASSKGPGGWSLDSVLNDKFGKLGSIAAPFATMAADKIQGLIASAAGKLLMGNIYGFSAGQALGQVGGILSGDPTAMVAGAAGLAGQLKPSASLRNDSNKESGKQLYYDGNVKNKTNDVRDLGNNYGPPINKTNDVSDIGKTYGPPRNQTNDVSNLGNNYGPPINKTNDVSNLGKTYGPPRNQTNDVSDIGKTYGPPRNQTNEVDDIGNIYE